MTREAPGAGRVIAGSARGIRLVGPAQGVRPLGDRLKQALFAILEPELRGRSFLDLFAGSGAAGIEALSRGAASATFVESDRPALAALERNLAAAHLGGPDAIVVRADVLAWLAAARAAQAYR
ncbi:MAG TPA: RsmD family RNA methyltransferase, partial [Candidatus Binatus sp.]|nr:RsmD family RNA methyltransferase [Candidatus Binatus sp.]